MKISLQHFKGLLPQQITVITKKTKDGFVAEIKELPHCYTQAVDLFELIEMVNDAVFTYLDIPKKYVEKLGIVYLPEKLANEFTRLRLQKACHELTKDITASRSIFRKTSFAK